MTNCNYKHALKLTCRHVHVRPHCFILTEECSCRLELEYFAEKISKNRLVCKNAVTLAYYKSCRLLVMGSCSRSNSLGVAEAGTLNLDLRALKSQNPIFFS